MHEFTDGENNSHNNGSTNNTPAMIDNFGAMNTEQITETPEVNTLVPAAVNSPATAVIDVPAIPATLNTTPVAGDADFSDDFVDVNLDTVPASTDSDTSGSDTHMKNGKVLSDDVNKNNKAADDGKDKSSFSIAAFLCCTKRYRNGREMGVYESSLEDRSNCLSNWLLTYLDPLLFLGARKLLDSDDMGVPSRQDLAARAYKVAQEAWLEQVNKTSAKNEKLRSKYEKKLLAKCKNEEEREKIKAEIAEGMTSTSSLPPFEAEEASIAFALMKGFGQWQIFMAMLYYFVSTLLNFIPVLILNDLVKFFQSGKSINEFSGYANPWVEVVALAVVPFLVSLLQTRHSTIMAHCAVFVRTAVSTLLYRKTLHVSASGRAQTSIGQVVNMMSNDTSQLQRFLQYIGMVAAAPLQIIIALILIYQQVGNATWVGVGFMLALMPVNTVIFSIISKQRREVLKNSDLRVKTMNEILAGIRIIKFYAWEKPFGREVGAIRARELAALTRLAYTVAIGFSLILMSAPLIQPILVFLTYVSIQNKPLDAATAFTTVALFNIMRMPFAFLPMGLLQYIQSRISLRRLQRYLALPELSEYVDHSPPPDLDASLPAAQHGSITVENGSFAWVDPEGKFIKPIQEESRRSKKKKETKSVRSSKGNEGGSIASHSDDEPMRASTHSHRTSTSVNTDGATLESQHRGPVITLQDLNFTIKAGDLVAVVGEVGSGKSSFLSAILGEMEPVEGSKVYIPRPSDAPPGYVAYCSQTPWVVNDTLRGNVVFGREFVQERYDKVLEACALLDDIAILPAGDMTEIGERGINMSGGQKARVSLARAMYSTNTRVMLMDDPLSAVDAHVGEHIFSHAITGNVSQGTTRVLVTHHVHLLSRCDSVIVLERGRIKHHGKYRDLIAQGIDFAGAVDLSKAKLTEDNEEETDGLNEKLEDVPLVKEEETTAEKKADMKEKGEKLVKDEERNAGHVAGSAYIHYARAGGYLIATCAFIVQGLGRASEVMAGFWLSIWSAASLKASMAGHPHTRSQTDYYLGIYALFGLLGVVGIAVRSLIVAVHRLRASKLLHNNLTQSILRAPVAFFDVTPVGRILNRFAADMDKVDLELTQSLSQGMTTLFSVLGALGAIIAATKGSFLIALIPIGYIYYLIQNWFRNTSTELQRINSIANSPIFADFSQTLTGTSTIRAYGEEKRFFEHCQQSFDTMNTSYILLQLCSNWLGLRLDLLGGLMSAFVGGIAVGTASSGFIPAGWLGLALSYCIEVTGYLKMGVRMIATIEAQMNSVERILYYTQKVESEAPEYIPDKDPDPSWPQSGEVEFRNTSMRYRDGPLVLKNINVKIKPGQRVGVCGRTGSGKSSMMISLFRISEIEKDGQILIDGVDTSQIGVSTLRLHLSIIPQDPILFSNTVRYNLDPFKEATDDEIWNVLEKVKMSEYVDSLPGGLDEAVTEGGENFSQGQRQLLCIARSLIRKPKILVMDEATASIDNATDNAIQEMIRENFKDTTVLTIAHRLNTIMDSDRVLVLENGRVAEYDTPDRLLSNENGLFRAMVESSKEAKSHG